MPQACTQSSLPRAIGVGIVKLSAILCVAVTLSTLVRPGGASAQSTPEEVLIEFQGVDAPPAECMRTDSQEEALSCYWDSGFPYASLCSHSLYSQQEEICLGPRVRIADFNFSDEIPFRDSLIQSLGGFERGQFYNHRQVLDFLFILRDRIGVVDAEITFVQAGSRSVRMLVVGRPPRSSIRGGLYLDSYDGFVSTVTGSHFFGKNAPGFLDYYLQGSNNRLGEVGISIPISVNRESSTRLGVRAYDTDGQYADLQGATLNFSVSQHANNAARFPGILSYGGAIVVETFNAAGLISQNDDYGSIFANWGWDKQDFVVDKDLRFNAYWLSGHGLTSKLSFSASSINDLSYNSEAILRNISNLELMLGSTSKAPLSERVFIGGANLRGFHQREIGRTGSGDFANWGKRWSFTSQFELLWPIQREIGDTLVGVHADLGLISDDNFDIGSYGSLGLVGEFKLFEDLNVKLTLSRTNISRNNLTISLSILNN